MKYGKIWGETKPLLQTPFVEVHELRLKPGYHCSEHHHRHKWNAFYVVSGRLRIVVEKSGYDLIDATEIGPGEITTVCPGEVHQFDVIQESVALEIYYPEPLSEDIVRRNCGGGG